MAWRFPHPSAWWPALVAWAQRWFRAPYVLARPLHDVVLADGRTLMTVTPTGSGLLLADDHWYRLRDGLPVLLVAPTDARLQLLSFNFGGMRVTWASVRSNWALPRLPPMPREQLRLAIDPRARIAALARVPVSHLVRLPRPQIPRLACPRLPDRQVRPAAVRATVRLAALRPQVRLPPLPSRRLRFSPPATGH